jgi:hypothetical protein
MHQPWNLRRVIWLAGNAGIGGSHTTDERPCTPACPPPKSSLVAGPAFGFQWGGDSRIHGPSWLEISGHLVIDRFLGSDTTSSFWVELGVSAAFRFDDPSVWSPEDD